MSLTKQEDLLNKLSTQKTDSKEGTLPDVTIKTGDNIIAKVEDSNTEEKVVETKKVEVTNEDNETNEELKDWTKDNLYKELQKTREEAKQWRLKSRDAVEQIKEDTDQRLKEYDLKLQEALKFKEELEAKKAEEADKKKSLEEKLVDREERIKKEQLEREALDNQYKEKLRSLEGELEDYRLEQKVQEDMYKEKLNKELESIPEEFRRTADLIVKGAGSTRDAYIEIAQAKANKVFDRKEVVVSHQVPDAKSGARSSNERMDEAKKAERQSMNSKDLIGTALKSIKSGQPNTAFKSNNR